MDGMRKYSRREILKAGLMAGAYAFAGGGIPLHAASSKEKLNVLFIAVDDLRPQLGCYGASVIQTPNIDALAARGTLFNRAYCQQAVCSPSRSSLMTGCRPDTTKVYGLDTHFRLNIPDAVTIPQYFKQHGYHSQSLSKIYHTDLEDPQSWSVPAWHPGDPGWSADVVEKDPKTGTSLKVKRSNYAVRGPAWENPDVPDNELWDGKTADKAVQTLRNVKDKPFFLAVGFHKPHLPFVAPKKYYDMYPPRSLSLADNPYPPKDCPKEALTTWGEIRSYKGIPKSGPVSDRLAMQLIRGYYASVSYIDAQVGKVVNELDRLGLRDNTVIVLWGDHGWHLGEHGLWCKHTNFEVATHSPLIFSAPGQKNAGTKTDALAEFVDVYPTLCELSGLPVPDGLEGTSLVPVINEPSRKWKQAVFSQYPRGKVMGYSMRTDRYRYTEWSEPGKEPVGVELYDHQTDPDENVNLANQSGNKELTAKLSKMLHDGWKAAVPQR